MQAITKVFSDIVKPYIDSENQTLANEVNTMNNVLGAKNLWDIETHHFTNSNLGGTITWNNEIATITTTSTAGSGRYFGKDDMKKWFADYAGMPIIISFDVKGDSTFNALAGIASQHQIELTTEYQHIEIDFSDVTEILSIVFYNYDTTSAHTITVTNFMLRSASIKDPTYVPYAKPNTELTKDDIGLTANAFANGAVNLLENKATSQVINGITWVVNSDGTIIASGTATARSYIQITDVTLPAGTYRLSGTPKGGNYSSSYGLGIESLSKFDNGDGVEFTLPSETTFNVILNIRTGTGAINITFKPMITVADMPNSDYNHYVPYAKSNKELTEDVATLNDVTVTDMSSSFTGVTSGVINMIKYGKVRQLQFDNVAFANDAIFPTLDTADRPKAVAFSSLAVTNDNTSGRVWIRNNGTFGTGNVLGKTVMGSITWIVS